MSKESQSTRNEEEQLMDKVFWVSWIAGVLFIALALITRLFFLWLVGAIVGSGIPALVRTVLLLRRRQKNVRKEKRQASR